MPNYVIRDGELYHWRYVKRERVNGKWRYYYDEAQMKKDLGVDAMNRAKSQYNQAADRTAIVERKKNSSMPEGAEKRLQVAIAQKQLDKSVDEYRKLQAEFHKTPLGKLDKLVESGKSTVEKLLKKDVWKDFSKRKK